MSIDNSTTGKEAANDVSGGEEVWPRKLNKILIGVGVLAFGLIIADRLVNMIRVDDLPDTVQIDRSVDTQSVAEVDVDPIEKDAKPPSDEIEASPVAQLDAIEPEADSTTTVAAYDDSSQSTDVIEEVLNIEDVFGQRLVFVSASEPQYVITDDDRRIDVGGDKDDQTTLTGVTSQLVVLEKNGELLTIDLPDPSVE